MILSHNVSVDGIITLSTRGILVFRDEGESGIYLIINLINIIICDIRILILNYFLLIFIKVEMLVHQSHFEQKQSEFGIEVNYGSVREAVVTRYY